MPPRSRRPATFEPSIHPQDRSIPFRLNAKHLFLTYPRFTVEKQLLFDHINNKYPLKRAVIAEESHQDGEKHLHAYLEFTRKLDLRNWDIFDYEGHHCNLQAARKPDACIIYCQKEDPNPLLFGQVDTRDISSLCELAENTPEESEWIDLCYSKKVTFHPLSRSTQSMPNGQGNSIWTRYKTCTRFKRDINPLG